MISLKGRSVRGGDHDHPCQFQHTQAAQNRGKLTYEDRRPEHPTESKIKCPSTPKLSGIMKSHQAIWYSGSGSESVRRERLTITRAA